LVSFSKKKITKYDTPRNADNFYQQQQKKRLKYTTVLVAMEPVSEIIMITSI